MSLALFGEIADKTKKTKLRFHIESGRVHRKQWLEINLMTPKYQRKTTRKQTDLIHSNEQSNDTLWIMKAGERYISQFFLFGLYHCERM